MTQFPSATIRLRKSKRAHYSRRLTARHRSAACTQRVHAVAQHRLQQQGPVLLRRGALQSAIIRKLRVPIAVSAMQTLQNKIPQQVPIAPQFRSTQYRECGTPPAADTLA